MNKVFFLDRDGVINKKRSDYVKNVEELEILPNLDTIIKKIKQNNYLVIVITNQSVINRGLSTHQKIQAIHEKIQSKLEMKIDGFFYCPHRPDEKCGCRKPKTGLLELAATQFDIDFKNSWFIGDSESDILAGEKMGCNTKKIKSEYFLENAVNTILK
ncbi:D-glycero-alpha-D-manno-heptose-1,7-bisphosphate 7-phosphatase [Nitrosopumilus piranensis]|uniref:D,D-heptose 1,7-bisphosphate phosphatase n=1 Tax=Nitrosopumilus piranensis TaxID=1582439 RepID=A0A0C5BWB4_9ARCH|nr:HAD family hydrolase [Nitrosopumilus piranensis]AJM91270.1 D,D-heptose 1,7-bisphosphate phosphatase [Nitrosopumilus piranensis]